MSDGPTRVVSGTVLDPRAPRRESLGTPAGQSRAVDPGGGSSEMSTGEDRSVEVTHPRLAFVERGRRERATGVTVPPEGGPPTAGPTAGQWGSG